MNEIRLIDANALENAAIPCEIHNGASTELCVPLYQIRNAPTVTPDMAQVLAYESGKANADRPTGKWIMTSQGDYECSRCRSPHTENPPFCPWCGSKNRTIRKEEENEK